jgi:hypothetical protein
MQLRGYNYRIGVERLIPSHLDRSPHFIHILSSFKSYGAILLWKGMLRMHISMFVEVLSIAISAVVIETWNSG